MFPSPTYRAGPPEHSSLSQNVKIQDATPRSTNDHRPPGIYGTVRLCRFGDFQSAHRQWVEQALERGRTVREDHWSEAIAVGSLAFVERVKSELSGRAMHRAVEEKDGAYALRERSEAYNGDFGGESEPLTLENTVLWNESAAAAET